MGMALKILSCWKKHVGRNTNELSKSIFANFLYNDFIHSYWISFLE